MARYGCRFTKEVQEPIIGRLVPWPKTHTQRQAASMETGAVHTNVTHPKKTHAIVSMYCLNSAFGQLPK